MGKLFHFENVLKGQERATRAALIFPLCHHHYTESCGRGDCSVCDVKFCSVCLQNWWVVTGYKEPLLCSRRAKKGLSALEEKPFPGYCDLPFPTYRWMKCRIRRILQFAPHCLVSQLKSHSEADRPQQWDPLAEGERLLKVRPLYQEAEDSDLGACPEVMRE